MSRREAVTVLAEEGMRVLCWQLVQDDRGRQFRVIRGLAWNAGGTDD